MIFYKHMRFFRRVKYEADLSFMKKLFLLTISKKTGFYCEHADMFPDFRSVYLNLKPQCYNFNKNNLFHRALKIGGVGKLFLERKSTFSLQKIAVESIIPEWNWNTKL